MPLLAHWVNVITMVLIRIGAIGAVLTVVYAVKAYREQSRQTRLLREQADRDIEQRRRDQASRVFTWIEPRPFDGDEKDMREAACIRNASSQPVYDVELCLGEGRDRGWHVLMPGCELARPGLGTSYIDGHRPVWITFRDSAGIRWQATADGHLIELRQ